MSSQEDHIIDGPSCTNNAQHNKSKQVLNIYHTAIENEDTSETQKAIIQEMCNVVWKALDVKNRNEDNFYNIYIDHNQF